MTASHSLPAKSRQALLDELASLTSMERGTLFEEYRRRTVPDGSDPIILGPYFKHQVWAEGKNQTSRVPSHEVDALRHDLENGKRFTEVTTELAGLAIAQSRAQRKIISPMAALASGQELLEKKNSMSSASRKNTGKPKSSSPPSKRKSDKRASPP